MFRPQINAREHSEVDAYPLQEEFASFFNTSFELQDWDELDQNELSHGNPAIATDNIGLPINKTSKANLQKSVERRLAPRGVNKVSFSEDNLEPAPQDELTVQQMESCNPPSNILRESHAPTVDPLASDDLTLIEPHLFDLSLSPIIDPTPMEAENTTDSHDQLQQCTDISIAITECPKTSSIPINRNLPDQNNLTMQDISSRDIDKSLTTNQYSLPHQQHTNCEEAKTGTYSEKEVQLIIQDKTGKDLKGLEVNIAKGNVSSFHLSEATNTHANSFQGEDSQSLQNPNLIVEHFEENIANHDKNHHVGMSGAANNVIIQQKNMGTGKEVKPIRCSDEDQFAQQARKNTSNDDFLQQEAKVNEIRSQDFRTNVESNFKPQEDCNESVDIFNVTADTLQTEARNTVRFEERLKDVGPQFESPQALDETVDIFSTPKYNISLSNAIHGRKEDKANDNSPKEFQPSSSRTFTKPSVPRVLEKDNKILNKGHILKKTHFKAPYKAVSGSPFIGYPPDRKNVTSTPKEAEEKKVRRLGSGYSSDSSDMNDTVRGNNDPKSPKGSAYKHFTAKTGAKLGRTCSALGQDSLVKRKLEFKPKFMSKLSSFKFSVLPSKKAKIDIPSYNISNITPNMKVQDSPNISVQSTPKSNGSVEYTSVNLRNPTQAAAELGKGLFKGRQEVSETMEDTNESQSEMPDRAIVVSACNKKHIEKHAGKLDKVQRNRDLSEPLALKKTCLESNKKTKFSGVVKASAKKRKKEDKTHKEIAKKKKTKSNENNISSNDDMNKKEKTNKVKCVRKKTLKNKAGNKAKNTKGCPNKDTESHAEDSSNTGAKQSKNVQKSVVSTETSQDTSFISQVGLHHTC